MTNRIMNIFVIWLKEFNVMLLLQLLELKEHLNKKFTMNLVLNLCALEDDSDNCVFYTINIKQLPSYLYELIPKSNHNFDHIDPYYWRTDIFNYSFFPFTIVEWNKLDPNWANAKSYICFRNSLLKIGRPNQLIFLGF